LLKQAKPKDLFSTSHQRAMSSRFLGSRASGCAVIALEDKSHKNECFPLPPPFS